MAGIKVQSVKFKKDYMMLLAFLLFFLIVFSECFLAFWLPWHLKLDRMWAEQVAQQELIDQFDGLRGSARRSSEKLSKPASSEALLICRILDRAAAYMHQYGKMLTPEQCKLFGDALRKLQGHLRTVSGNRAYSRTVELDSSKFVRTLRGVKSVRPLLRKPDK